MVCKSLKSAYSFPRGRHFLITTWDKKLTTTYTFINVISLLRRRPLSWQNIPSGRLLSPQSCFWHLAKFKNVYLYQLLSWFPHVSLLFRHHRFAKNLANTLVCKSWLRQEGQVSKMTLWDSTIQVPKIVCFYIRIYPSTVFSIFDWIQWVKICRHHWKEGLKIS